MTEQIADFLKFDSVNYHFQLGALVQKKPSKQTLAYV